jgi:hypothetical protein
MTEQVRKIRHQVIPECVQDLYYTTVGSTQRSTSISLPSPHRRLWPDRWLVGLACGP